MTPTETFKKTLQCVLDRDMAGYASLWAEDGTFIFPFAVPGATRKLVGPAEIAEYMKDYPSIVDVHSFPDVKIHLTHDPEVIVAEFSAEGVSLASGQPYRMPYIGVIRVRNGKIVEYRDYWNHAVDTGAFEGFNA